LTDSVGKIEYRATLDVIRRPLFAAAHESGCGTFETYSLA
jgi:hypothetical protein